MKMKNKFTWIFLLAVFAMAWANVGVTQAQSAYDRSHWTAVAYVGNNNQPVGIPNWGGSDGVFKKGNPMNVLYTQAGVSTGWAAEKTLPGSGGNADDKMYYLIIDTKEADRTIGKIGILPWHCSTDGGDNGKWSTGWMKDVDVYTTNSISAFTGKGFLDADPATFDNSDPYWHEYDYWGPSGEATGALQVVQDLPAVKADGTDIPAEWGAKKGTATFNASPLNTTFEIDLEAGAAGRFIILAFPNYNTINGADENYRIFIKEVTVYEGAPAGGNDCTVKYDVTGWTVDAEEAPGNRSWYCGGEAGDPIDILDGSDCLGYATNVWESGKSRFLIINMQESKAVGNVTLYQSQSNGAGGVGDEYWKDVYLFVTDTYEKPAKWTVNTSDLLDGVPAEWGAPVAHGEYTTYNASATIDAGGATGQYLVIYLPTTITGNNRCVNVTEVEVYPACSIAEPPLPYGQYLQCYEFPSDAVAGTTWTLKDTRDFKEYSAIKFSDGSIWLTTDFKYTDGLTVDVDYKLKPDEGAEAGERAYYTYAQAQAVAPEGWRLPTLAEWRSMKATGAAIENGGAAPYGSFLWSGGDNGGGRYDENGNFVAAPWGDAPYNPWTTVSLDATHNRVLVWGCGNKDDLGSLQDDISGDLLTWSTQHVEGFAHARYIFDPALAALREPCNIDVSPEVVLDDVDIILGESDAWTSDGLHCGWGDSPGLKYKLELTEAGNLIYAPTADFQFSFFINTVDNMGFGGDVADIYIAGPATETVTLTAGTYYLYFCLPNGISRCDAYDLNLQFSIPDAATLTPLGTADLTTPVVVSYTEVAHAELPYTQTGTFGDYAVATNDPYDAYFGSLAYKLTVAAAGEITVTDTNDADNIWWRVAKGACPADYASYIAEGDGTVAFNAVPGEYFIIGVMNDPSWSPSYTGDENYEFATKISFKIPGVISSLPFEDEGDHMNTPTSEYASWGPAWLLWGAVALKYDIMLPTTTTAKIYFNSSNQVFFIKKYEDSGDFTWLANYGTSGEEFTFQAGQRYNIAFTLPSGVSASAPYFVGLIPNGVDIPAVGVTLSETKLSVNKLASHSLAASVQKGWATNQAVTWSSADPSIATVTQSGLITGVEEGTTTITVTTVDGGYTATATVTVTASSIITVTNTDDAGAGSLRQAVLDATDGDVIVFDAGIEFNTIVLESAITLDKELTIIGGSQVLTAAAAGYPAFQIPTGEAGNKAITISRLHFDSFDNTGNRGGAIAGPTQGTLTVNVCIFTNNKASDAAISKVGDHLGDPKVLTAYGCTFISNEPAAINTHDHGMRDYLLGNIFIDNDVVSNDVAIATYNAYTQSTTFTALHPLSTVENNVQVTGSASDLIGGDGLPLDPALQILPATLPDDYPTVDFYGTPIVGGGYAGAVQPFADEIFIEVTLPYSVTGTYADIVNDALTGTYADFNGDGGAAGFTFTVTEAGKLTIDCAGYDLWLFNDESVSGGEIAYQYGSLTDFDLEPGTYYLVIDDYDNLNSTYDLSITFAPTAINNIDAAKVVKSIKYYDLLGRPTTKSAKGIIFQEILYEDGTKTFRKTLVQEK